MFLFYFNILATYILQWHLDFCRVSGSWKPCGAEGQESVGGAKCGEKGELSTPNYLSTWCLYAVWEQNWENGIANSFWKWNFALVSRLGGPSQRAPQLWTGMTHIPLLWDFSHTGLLWHHLKLSSWQFLILFTSVFTDLFLEWNEYAFAETKKRQTFCRLLHIMIQYSKNTSLSVEMCSLVWLRVESPDCSLLALP